LAKLSHIFTYFHLKTSIFHLFLPQNHLKTPKNHLKILKTLNFNQFSPQTPIFSLKITSKPQFFISKYLNNPFLASKSPQNTQKSPQNPPKSPISHPLFLHVWPRPLARHCRAEQRRGVRARGVGARRAGGMGGRSGDRWMRRNEAVRMVVKSARLEQY
jgi:hypothetical protein